MAHKSKITHATSPLFCNPLPSKTHTTANIDATFSNYNEFWYVLPIGISKLSTIECKHCFPISLLARYDGISQTNGRNITKF